MADPEWAAFIPEMRSGGPKCRLPAHADCTPLDVESTARHLESGGTLGSMEGYEVRPGQLDMLRAVTQACNGRTHLMVEAGTGVGKSLAYLVPAVLWSFTNDTPVVISTATRNLQSQLTDHDLPRAAKTLGEDAPKLRWSVLKGRANYLCLRALEEYMQGGWWTLDEQEKNEFTRFLEWLYATKDGDLDSFGGEELRSRLACPSEDCWGRSCRYAGRCFIAKARSRALQSHVIIANHALVLAEAANPGAGLLPAYGRLVFDEAHNLEDIATEYFSYEFSKPALMQVLGRLARPGRAGRGRPARTRGLLGTVERQLAKGAFGPTSVAEGIRELVNRAHIQSGFVVTAADALFGVLRHMFAPAPKEDVIRYRAVPVELASVQNAAVAKTKRQYCLKGMFADYTSAQWDEKELHDASIHFEDAFARLQSIVQSLASALEAASEKDETSLFGEIAAQAKGLVGQFTLFLLETKCVLEGADASRVFWIEKMAADEPSRGKRTATRQIRLVGAPLSVAKEMKRCFYDAKDTVVLCSATLRAGDRFDYMARKLGMDLVAAEQPEDEGEIPAGPRVRTLVAASPFDYFRQTRVLAPDCLPDPAAEPSAYAEALAKFLVDLFFATQGRALTLFTAYDMMRQVAELCRPRLADAGIGLLVQGEGLSREEMVRRLKEAGRGMVLFGAQSFWEGVDVPGQALSCVVMARLPFPQVGEPITEARSERVVEQGGSGFRDFALPEALIRFRQGFGRLVRTKTDRGVVVIADSRIARKNYGAIFRKSIAATVQTVSSTEETIARVTDFLNASPRKNWNTAKLLESAKAGAEEAWSGNIL